MSKTCNNCTDRAPTNVPYVVHESAMARAERQAKRLVAVIILLIVLLVGSNIGWMVYENSFEDYVITQEVEQEADNGENHFIGGDYIGETKSENKN